MDNEVPFTVEVKDLRTGYGKREVLHSISFSVEPSTITALIGHNGAGKSSVLRAVFGLLPVWEGEVYFEGVPVVNWSPETAIRRGISYLPQGISVFGEMSVRENLEIGLAAIKRRSEARGRIREVTEMFPQLGDLLSRKARFLSGGEKQMVAIGRAFVTAPRLLLLDEPSAGLAARLTNSFFNRIREIAKIQKITVLVVEQKVREVLEIADGCCVLRNGRVSFKGAASDLSDGAKLKDVYL
ncbi:MAG: ABC transporter ATP-binding protein [bacterium]|nr:ABC transporter ATP-binding protein [bacterium]